MIKNIRFCVIAVVVAASTALTSCYYDPYFTSVNATYGTGYSSGYYGGSSGYSSSVFISTGDPEWGYDPHLYSYYNYRRRCYYDPYLNGFYPVGYRPPVVVGCAHPYGWRPGARYCPPPRRVSNITIVNYRNRESAYRRGGHIHQYHGNQHYHHRSNRSYNDYEHRHHRRLGPSAYNNPVNHTQTQPIQTQAPINSIASSTPSQTPIAEPTTVAITDSSPTSTNIESAPSSAPAPPSSSESSSTQASEPSSPSVADGAAAELTAEAP